MHTPIVNECSGRSTDQKNPAGYDQAPSELDTERVSKKVCRAVEDETQRGARGEEGQEARKECGRGGEAHKYSGDDRSETCGRHRLIVRPPMPFRKVTDIS
jgi:hypothetical protein